jgi:ketosteroid isomerase-like protein
MSQETNLELMRRFAAATVKGQADAAEALLGANVEIDDRDIPDADGHDSFREWQKRWNASWESWRIEGLELLPSGDDKVLALFRMVVKGKGSGIELTRDDALLAEFADGKIVRLGYYNDQAQARGAAGLPA